MSLATVVIETLMITPSGALSPGPLTTATAVLGARAKTPASGAAAGLGVALGHMAFELPYVLAIAALYGAISDVVNSLTPYLAAVSIAFIAFFAYLTARDGLAALKGAVRAGQISVTRGPVATGVIFTGLNPYFLLWWLTVGLPLVQDAHALGAVGLTAMYTAHVWMDYAWLAVVGALGGGAGRVLGARGYGYLLLALAAMLAAFGLNIALKTYLGISLV